MAGHPSSVVNNSWDVATERVRESRQYSEASVCALPWLVTEAGDSLSICLQLADLEKGHQIIFGMTRTSCGAGHRAELRRWHWREKKRGDKSA